jgi:hypothetical protein
MARKKNRTTWGVARSFRADMSIERRHLLSLWDGMAKEVLVGLAKVLASTYRLDKALEILIRTQSIYDQLIGQIFSFGSESQRMDYFMKIRSSIDIFLSLVFQNENAARVAMNLVLRRKAINVEAMTIQRDAILSGKYPQLKAQFDQLETLKQQIAMKTLEGPGKKD